MAKRIAIPNKPQFRVRLIEGFATVAKHAVLEMRQSEDTGNVFVRFKDQKGKEFCGLLID